MRQWDRSERVCLLFKEELTTTTGTMPEPTLLGDMH